VSFTLFTTIKQVETDFKDLPAKLKADVEAALEKALAPIADEFKAEAEKILKDLHLAAVSIASSPAFEAAYEGRAVSFSFSGHVGDDTWPSAALSVNVFTPTQD
jgi:hypothetical protein